MMPVVEKSVVEVRTFVWQIGDLIFDKDASSSLGNLACVGKAQFSSVRTTLVCVVVMRAFEVAGLGSLLLLLAVRKVLPMGMRLRRNGTEYNGPSE